VHETQSGIVAPRSCEIARRCEHPLGRMCTHVTIDGFIRPAHADERISGFCIARRTASGIVEFDEGRSRITRQERSPTILMRHPPAGLQA